MTLSYTEYYESLENTMATDVLALLQSKLSRVARYKGELGSASSSRYYQFAVGMIDFNIRVSDHDNTSNLHTDCIAFTVNTSKFVFEADKQDLADENLEEGVEVRFDYMISEIENNLKTIKRNLKIHFNN